MSAPSLAERDAEYLKYGFLSIRAGNAIRHKLGGEALSEEEQDILRNADELLRQIASGVELATSGNIRNNDIDPLASMRALGVARDPIRHIQGEVQQHKLAELFVLMAETLQASSGSSSSPTKPQKESLSLTASFFDELYKYVATILDRRGATSPMAHQTSNLFPA